MKIIDAHSHVGNFGSWARFDFDLPRLKDQMSKFDIEKTLLTGEGPRGNDAVLDAFQKEPDLIVPVAWVDPKSPGVLSDIRRFVEKEGFRAIKLHPLFDAYCADDTFVDPVIELAGELGVPVFIHSGHPPYSLPWQIGWLAERHPSVPMVMLHMGHAHGVYVDAALKVARRYRNIYLDTSGTTMSVKIREAYDTVGHDRVLFGIDSPFHEPSVEIEKTAPRTFPNQTFGTSFTTTPPGSCPEFLRLHLHSQKNLVAVEEEQHKPPEKDEAHSPTIYL